MVGFRLFILVGGGVVEDVDVTRDDMVVGDDVCELEDGVTDTAAGMDIACGTVGITDAEVQNILRKVSDPQQC